MITTKLHTNSPIKIACLAILSVALICCLSVLLSAKSTYAANAKDFNPGRIIDDAIFYNANAMNASQIQTFLNSKNPNCDTNGTQPASDWGRPDITHATLASYIRNGTNGYTKNTAFHAPPYVCLRNFKQNTPQMEATSGLCGALSARTNRTAAQIIDDVAKACGINPQVLIVLLQKEQSLVTDTWPLQTQYAKATGFACPDTAPCDPQYNGYFYQVYHAARQFKVYKTRAGDYNYIAGRTNRIYWNPDLSRCGSSQVYIQNQATAALYIYTPYRPNQAALNNLYGEGDSCSAYGNRNFWRLFTDWFGSPTGGVPLAYGINITSPITITPLTETTSTVSFTVKNFADSRVSFDTTVVQCRNYQNANCDSNYGGAWYVDPDQERTFSYTINISEANTYRIIPYVSMGGVWYRYDTPSGVDNMTTVQKPELTITSPVNLSPAYMAPRSTQSVGYQLKNTGKSPVALSTTVIQCRYEGRNCDSNYGGAITIGIGETKTFNGYQLTSMDGGNHTLIPYYMVNGQWYQYKPSDSAPSSRIVNVADLELSGSGITFSNESPIPGETITASFGALNKGTAALTSSRLILQCRLNTAVVCDPEHTYNDTLNAGAQKSYSAPIKITKAGSYVFVPYFEHMNTWNVYSKGTASAVTRTLTVAKYVADMRLVGDISLSPAQPKPGDTVTATYKVKNFGSKPAYYQRSILQCRLDVTTNCDPTYNTPGIVIEPNAEHTFTSTFTNIKNGTYTFKPYYEQNDEWHLYGNGTASSNVLSIRTSPLTITSELSPMSGSVSKGSSRTYTYTAKNIGTTKITIDSTVLQCRRLQNNANCDSAYGGVVALNPGESRQFTSTILFRDAGQYRLTPYYKANGLWYSFSIGTGSYTKEITAL